jgi:serine/threonine-protein kinase
VLLLVLLLAAAVFIFFSLRDYLNVPEVRVPKVVGINLDDAYRALRGVHLEVSTFPAESGKAPDSIVSQNPAPGTLVRRGHTVSLGVYTPAARASVPNLVGKDQNEVNAALKKLDVQLSEVYDYSDKPAGTVITQKPAPGSTLGSDSRLELVLSRGPKVREVKLPDLNGLSVADAKKQLAKLGVHHVETVASSLGFFSSERVTAQTPAADQSAPVTSTVTLFYTLPESRVVKVPQVAGESLPQALQVLRAAGLQPAWVSYVHDTGKPQGVLSVKPDDYTLPGSPVVLTMNGPEDAKNYTLPQDVSGPQNAPTPNTSLGPPPNTTGQPLPTEGTQGNPRGGEPSQTTPSNPAAPNQSASDQSARTIPITFNPANFPFLKGKSYRFKLVVKDDQGTRDAIDREFKAGESVNTTVQVYGKAQMQTYINDIFYQAWNP